MTCFNCHVDSPLINWLPAKVKCVSSSCREDDGRECPGCGQKVSHVWLDGQAEWRHSENYKP